MNHLIQSDKLKDTSKSENLRFRSLRFNMHYNTDIFDSEMLLGAGIMVVFQYMPLVLLIQIGFRIRSSHHDDDINDAPIPYCLMAIRLSLAGFLRFRDFLHSSCLRVVGLQLFHAVAFALTVLSQLGDCWHFRNVCNAFTPK